MTATFVDDQAAAAAEHAEALLGRCSQRLPHGHRLSPAIAGRFVEQLRTGDATTCRHLTGQAPSIGVWMVAVPTRVLCPRCARAVAGEVPGKLACAVCGRTDPSCAVYFDRFGMVVLTFTLCGPCRHARPLEVAR